MANGIGTWKKNPKNQYATNIVKSSRGKLKVKN